MLAYRYTVIETLPAGAQRVSLFAKNNNISVGYVYMSYKRGKASYEIVNYQGTNYIIVNTAKN